MKLFRIHKQDMRKLEDNGRAGELAPQYWFTIVGANGETIATSETYTRKQSAKDSIRAIIIGCSGTKDIGRSEIEALVRDETGEAT